MFYIIKYIRGTKHKRENYGIYLHYYMTCDKHCDPYVKYFLSALCTLFTTYILSFWCPQLSDENF